MSRMDKLSDKLNEVYDDVEISEWLKEVAKSPITVENYLKVISKYLDYTEKTPIELIELAEDEEETKKMRIRTIRTQLNGFNTFLSNGGTYPSGRVQKPMANKSVSNHLAIVKSFYKTNYISIPNMKNRKDRRIIENDVVPTKDELRKALEHASLKLRTVLYIGSSSGLSLADILNLKRKDIRNVDGNDITTLRLQRHKTGVDFTTFLSPEATRSIKMYLEERNGVGTAKDKAKQMKWHEKHKVVSENDYLFIADKISDSYLENYDDELRSIRKNSLIVAFNSLAIKSGMSTGKGVFEKIRTHNFRKYFYSQLMNAGCSDTIINYMCGKTIPEDKETYFKANTDKLKNIYLTHLDELAFENTQSITIKNSNYKDLEIKSEIKDVQHKIDLLELEKRIELKEFNLQINDLESRKRVYETQIPNLLEHLGHSEVPPELKGVQKSNREEVCKLTSKIENIRQNDMQPIENHYAPQIKELKQQMEEIKTKYENG